MIASVFQESRAAKAGSRELRRLDFKLQIGTVSTAIEKGTPAQLETETARISQSRTADELRDLPIATRSMTAFLSLVRRVGQATTVTATYHFNGTRRNQSEIHRGWHQQCSIPRPADYPADQLHQKL